MRQKVFFKTFGCRTNIYDTNLMIENLKDFDLTKNEDEANIVVVNSCTVTNRADYTTRSYINRVKNEGKKVIIAGCGAMNRGKELFEQGSVFGVLGHKAKDDINFLLKSDKPFLSLGDFSFIDKSIVSNFEGKSKAFIKIQEGCDFNCSFCIIPSVRGRARSQDEDKILSQIEFLSKRGYKEFVLTGTNIGSYGKDKNSSLGKLLQKIGKLDIIRLRLGSIEPSQIDDSFKEILNEDWLERHLHIALQHTSDKMLKIMRRRNRALKDLELFESLAEQGFALGSDFIVAHPGESEEIWQEALEKFKKFPLTHLHCFIYSKRENTHSVTLKHEINGKVAKERLKTLENIIKENNLIFRQKNKTSLKVLVEEGKEDNFSGYDQFYNKIKIYSKQKLSRTWLDIEDYDIKEESNEARI